MSSLLPESISNTNQIGSLRALDKWPGAQLPFILQWLEGKDCPQPVKDALRDITATEAGQTPNMSVANRDLLARYLYYLYCSDHISGFDRVFLTTYAALFKAEKAKGTFGKTIPDADIVIRSIRMYASKPVASEEKVASELAVYELLDTLKDAAKHFGIPIPDWLKNFDVKDFVEVLSRESFEKLREDIEQFVTNLKGREKDAIAVSNTRPDPKEPVPPGVVVYCCIERELRQHGKSGVMLKEEAAQSFAEFAIACGKPDFGKTEPQAHGVRQRVEAEAKALKKSAVSAVTEALRERVSPIFDWPVFRGLSLRSSPHELQHKIGHVPPEQIIQLIGTFRHLVDARQHGRWGGARRDEMPSLGVFSGRLEAVVARQLREEMKKESSGFKSPEILEVVQNTHIQIANALSSGETNPHDVEHAWRELKPLEHGEKAELSGWAKAFHWLATVTQLGELAQWLFGKKGGSGPTPPAAPPAAHH